MGINLLANIVTCFWSLVKLSLTFGGMYLMYTEGLSTVGLLTFIAGSTVSVRSSEERVSYLRSDTDGN